MKQITRRKIIDAAFNAPSALRDKVDDLLVQDFPEYGEDGMIDVRLHTEKFALKSLKLLKSLGL